MPAKETLNRSRPSRPTSPSIPPSLPPSLPPYLCSQGRGVFFPENGLKHLVRYVRGQIPDKNGELWHRFQALSARAPIKPETEGRALCEEGKEGRKGWRKGGRVSETDGGWRYARISIVFLYIHIRYTLYIYTSMYSYISSSKVSLEPSAQSDEKHTCVSYHHTPLLPPSLPPYLPTYCIAIAGLEDLLGYFERRKLHKAISGRKTRVLVADQLDFDDVSFFQS